MDASNGLVPKQNSTGGSPSTHNQLQSLRCHWLGAVHGIKCRLWWLIGRSELSLFDDFQSIDLEPDPEFRVFGLSHDSDGVLWAYALSTKITIIDLNRHTAGIVLEHVNVAFDILG